jgi:methyl-accepting chemotaxis protein
MTADAEPRMKEIEDRLDTIEADVGTIRHTLKYQVARRTDVADMRREIADMRREFSALRQDVNKATDAMLASNESLKDDFSKLRRAILSRLPPEGRS